MSRSWNFYLQDIVDSANKIEIYCDGLSREDFFNDSRTVDAVIRNLEIIGEATKQLPEDVLFEMDEIPWTQIAGMRNILAHAYFGIDDDILWDVVKRHVPAMLDRISRYIAEHNDQ